MWYDVNDFLNESISFFIVGSNVEHTVFVQTLRSQNLRMSGWVLNTALHSIRPVKRYTATVSLKFKLQD